MGESGEGGEGEIHFGTEESRCVFLLFHYSRNAFFGLAHTQTHNHADTLTRTAKRLSLIR